MTTPRSQRQTVQDSQACAKPEPRGRQQDCKEYFSKQSKMLRSLSAEEQGGDNGRPLCGRELLPRAVSPDPDASLTRTDSFPRAEVEPRTPNRTFTSHWKLPCQVPTPGRDTTRTLPRSLSLPRPVAGQPLALSPP